MITLEGNCPPFAAGLETQSVFNNSNKKLYGGCRSYLRMNLCSLFFEC